MERREFLKQGGAVATGVGATALAAPAVVTAQSPTLQWRLASSFPKSLDILYGTAEFFAKRVSEMTGGRFQIRVHAGGEIVPPLQVLDAVHLPRGEREVARFAKLMADPPLDETLLRTEGAGLRHLGAVAVRPEAALPQLVAGAAVRFGARVTSVDGIDADLVVVCAGMGATEIVGSDSPAIEGRLGQVDWVAADGVARAVADGGYTVEAFGQIVFGATFEAADGAPRVSEAASAHNLDILARLRPDVTAMVSPPSSFETRLSGAPQDEGS